MAAVVDVDDQLARDDADLVAQVAAGNLEEPMAELIRRYEIRLYRFGVQALGDRGLAEDLVQECFLRLWRTAGRFDISRGTVGAYMTVMARSIAADLRKRPSSRPLAPVDEEQIPARPDDADRIVDALVVRDALDSLSAAHREVLTLGLGEGLTQTQIAERLGVPLGTVKTRMLYGLRALKAALAERGYHG